MRMAWLVEFFAGCASASLWLSLGVLGLPIVAIFAALAVRLSPALGLAGLLTGAGSLVVATTAIATARCDAFNSATSSCKSVGAAEYLVLGFAMFLIGIGLTIRVSRVLRLRDHP